MADPACLFLGGGEVLGKPLIIESVRMDASERGILQQKFIIKASVNFDEGKFWWVNLDAAVQGQSLL